MEAFHEPGSVEMTDLGGEMEASQRGSLKGTRNDLDVNKAIFHGAAVA